MNPIPGWVVKVDSDAARLPSVAGLVPDRTLVPHAALSVALRFRRCLIRHPHLIAAFHPMHFDPSHVPVLVAIEHATLLHYVVRHLHDSAMRMPGSRHAQVKGGGRLKGLKLEGTGYHTLFGKQQTGDPCACDTCAG